MAARLVLRRLLPEHIVEIVIDHILRDHRSAYRRWHFLLTREIDMLCHQYATRPWRWLPTKEDPRSPAFFDRVRKRGSQRRQFVDRTYLRTGRADEFIGAIEELTRPSGTRATAKSPRVRAEMRNRLYCWVVDARRYCGIRRHWHEHCEECHGLLGSQYSKLCFGCNRLYCRVCRLCECNMLVDC
jgi:hypothetical protein